jgi:hypothetical protein
VEVIEAAFVAWLSAVFKKPPVAASRLWELGDKLSRVPGQRRDTPGNEKWSGRWESNPCGRRFKAYEMRRFVMHRRLRAIGVRIFEL